MLKKHMAACLLASAFVAAPALAQTSTSPGAATGGGQPATTAPSTGASAGAGASGGSGRFITQQQQSQWRASRLIGVNVYGANNERIGDVNEVLVDRQGNADAVVVGVGGFLGMGEKNVALPFSAFEWVMEDTRRTASASGTANPGGTGTAGGAGMGTAGTAARTDAPGSTASTTAAGGTAGTGTTAGSGTTAGTGTAAGSGSARSGAERGYPDHAVLRMSKADLEKAPTFRYVGDTSSDRSDANRGTGSGAGTGMGTTGTGGGAAGGTSGTTR